MTASDTFCGVPRVTVDAIPPGTAAAVIGVPTSAGSGWTGADNGPYFLRTLSKQFTWGAPDSVVVSVDTGAPALGSVVDLGDIEADGPVEKVLDEVRRTVAGLPAGVVPSVIGGDHSITLGVVRGLLDRDGGPVDVVQFDHHLDLQLWGDPNGEPDPVFNTNVMSHVSRAIGPGRLSQVCIGPYAAVAASAVDSVGGLLAGVGRQLSVRSPDLSDPDRFRDRIGRGRAVHLSVDLDLLQPAEMSSTNYPAVAGLDVATLLRLIDLTLEQNVLIGFDVVEFAAERGARDPKTLADAARAALVFLHLLEHASHPRPTPGGDSPR